MTNLGKNILALLDAFSSRYNAMMDAEAKKHPEQYKCDHGVVFDEEDARTMDAYDIQKKYPRLNGTCPKGCGYVGIAYASSRHYYSGDW